MKFKTTVALMGFSLLISSCGTQKKITAPQETDVDGHGYSPISGPAGASPTPTPSANPGAGTPGDAPIAFGADYEDTIGIFSGTPSDRYLILDVRWGLHHGYCNYDGPLTVVASMRTIGNAVGNNMGTGTQPDVSQRDQFISNPNAPCSPDGRRCPMNWTYNSTVTKNDADGVAMGFYSNELVAWNFAVWNGSTWDRADGVFRPLDIVRRGIVGVFVGAAVFELRIHTTVGPYLMCY